ncbi:MAG: hypothetical protein RIR62_1586 [Pseudomonadota bacterium]
MTGVILVVDDIATNRVVLKAKLAQAFHQTVLAADGASCLAEARRVVPHLILLDYGLPDMTGGEVIAHLRADPRTRHIPVIVISASPLPEDRLAVLAAGAEDFLQKPVDDLLLMARIRNVLRLTEEWREEAGRVAHLAEEAADFTPPGRMALVMPRAERALALRRALAAESRDLVFPLTREAALAENGPAGHPSAEVFVVDAEGGGAGGGLALLSDLRSRSETRHAGICLWTEGAARPELAAAAFDLGADDVLSAAMPVAEVAARLQGVLARRRAAARLREGLRDRARLADIDPLTTLWNRRYALPRLHAMAAEARRQGTALGVMLLDLDRFKEVNDGWGHAAGDAVLREVARRLTCAAPDALIARWGGEEFLIAVAGLTAGTARDLAERLCHAVNARLFPLEGLPPVPITVSVGLALGDGREVPEDMIDRADAALMRSKSGGRNRVTVERSA